MIKAEEARARVDDLTNATNKKLIEEVSTAIHRAIASCQYSTIAYVTINNSVYNYFTNLGYKLTKIPSDQRDSKESWRITF